MDIAYIAILLAFHGLISVLAVGCARLQKRKAGMRRRHGTAAATAAANRA